MAETRPPLRYSDSIEVRAPDEDATIAKIIAAMTHASEKVQARVTNHASDPLPCHMSGARAAATEVAQIGDYIGRKYGGKHRRSF